MNELRIAEQSDTAKEQFVTTKELAAMLVVGESTVKRAVEELRPVLGGVSKNNQGGYLYTEKQATLIKQEIQKHHNLATRQIDTVSTEIEENQTIANALMILKRRNDELKHRAEVAEGVVSRIAESKGCYSLSQTAKALKLPYGRNTLNDKLKQMGLLAANGEPYQNQINEGHFKVVVKYINEYVGNKPVTLTTGKGLVYLAKRFNTEIDESIQADA